MSIRARQRCWSLSKAVACIPQAHPGYLFSNLETFLAAVPSRRFVDPYLPCAAHVGVLLVDCKLYVWNVFRKLDGSDNSRHSSTKVNDFQRPRFINGSFRHERVYILRICIAD